MSRYKARKEKFQSTRHDPLYQELTENPVEKRAQTKQAKQKKKKQKQLKLEKKEKAAQKVLPPDISKKLLVEAIAQQSYESGITENKEPQFKIPTLPRYDEESSDSEIDSIRDDISDISEMSLDPEDEKALEMFMSTDATRQTLAEMIMAKIKEKEEGIQSNQEAGTELHPKVINAYREIGKIMKSYSSGRVPKALKILPMLSNWEDILLLTRPDEWSPSAVFRVTKIFASNFNRLMAQRFYNMVLLPHVRENVSKSKKLNYHLYQALRKALYKPSAFFKGVLFPICEARDCTLQEAKIIGSVLKKTSVPTLDSSVALLKIADMPYSGANSMFIRVLLDKKYALPYPVIDSLVNHFMRFIGEQRKLPVLWHQSLLSFAQRYKTDITAEQKEALKKLMRIQTHPKITDEIRRELFSSKSRDDVGSAQLNEETMDEA